MVDAAPNQDQRGRFVPGNKAGLGNLTLRRHAAMRKALLAEVSEKDIRKVVRNLVRIGSGRSRDAVNAARLVLEYAVGKAGAMVDPDTLERDAEGGAVTVRFLPVPDAESVRKWLILHPDELDVLREAFPGRTG